jgi:hypothetical protein
VLASHGCFLAIRRRLLFQGAKFVAVRILWVKPWQRELCNGALDVCRKGLYGETWLLAIKVGKAGLCGDRTF